MRDRRRFHRVGRHLLGAQIERTGKVTDEVTKQEEIHRELNITKATSAGKGLLLFMQIWPEVPAGSSYLDLDAGKPGHS